MQYGSVAGPCVQYGSVVGPCVQQGSVAGSCMQLGSVAGSYMCRALFTGPCQKSPGLNWYLVLNFSAL